MSLTNAGAAAIGDIVAGKGTTPAFNAANAYVGAGDSSTAFAAGQTDLQAATNKLRKQVTGISGVYPSAVYDYTTTFGLSEANFAWNEVGLFNAAAAGVMLNRKTVALGTKPGTESWTVTISVTYAAA